MLRQMQRANIKKPKPQLKLQERLKTELNRSKLRLKQLKLHG